MGGWVGFLETHGEHVEDGGGKGEGEGGADGGGEVEEVLFVPGGETDVGDASSVRGQDFLLWVGRVGGWVGGWVGKGKGALFLFYSFSLWVCGWVGGWVGGWVEEKTDLDSSYREDGSP